MIPLTIQIRNFLSYGDTPVTLDFRPYRLIALSGKNGHGKSALLDAITWAIWGQARKSGGTPRAESGLLRLGQQKMMVSLDFYAQETHFRVTRHYTSDQSRGYTTLDFGIVDPGGMVTSLTAKAIRATQHKIESFIGLSYETFVNSAFLRQGHSNEFSKKSPRERKDVLSRILGLEKFETIKKMASAKSRENTILFQCTQQNLAKLMQELQEKDTILAQQTAHEKELKALDEAYTQQIAHIDKLEHALAKKAAKTAHLNQLRLKEKHLSDTIAHKTAEAIQVCQKIRNILRCKIIEQGPLEQGLCEAEKLLAVIRQTRMEKIAQQQQLMEAQQKKQKIIEVHTANFAQQKQALLLAKERTTAELTLRIQRQKQLSQTVTTAQTTIHTLNAERARIIIDPSTEDKLNQALEQTTKTAAKQEAALLRWRTTAIRLYKQEQLLTQTHLHTNPTTCPLCEQPLQGEHSETLQEKMGRKHRTIVRKCSRYQRLIPALKDTLAETKKSLVHLKQQQNLLAQQRIKALEVVNKLTQLQSDLAQHEHEQKACKAECATLEGKRAELDQQEKELALSEQETLQQNPDFQEIIHQFEKLKAALSNPTFSRDFAAEEKEIDAKISHVRQQLTQARQFEKQRLLLAEYKEHLSRRVEEVKNSKVDQTSLVQQINRTANNPIFPEGVFEQGVQEDTLEQTLSTCKEKLNTLRQTKEALLEKKGSIDVTVQQLLAKEKESAAQQIVANKQSQSMNEWNIVASALSKNGIQALLIDQVLPEIEEEANNLLSRLTNNRAHISIESLKDAKNGSVKETLDINISDQLGIRPYELFSGGEAFRIDFALRIALSKLLARRASATLNTLIIDEGFGSQDEEGLQHILDCIHKIQSDFEKIIIVSHLPMLKEEFPVNFSIVKNAQGSTITVLEHA